MKNNEAFKDLERHGVSEKQQNVHFGVEYPFKSRWYQQPLLSLHVTSLQCWGKRITSNDLSYFFK